MKILNRLFFSLIFMIGFLGMNGAAHAGSCDPGHGMAKNGSCNVCRAGTASPGGGQKNALCNTCSSGQICPGGTASQACPAGSYCPTTTSKMQCAAGTFSVAGAVSCTACPGNSTSGAGADTCRSSAGFAYNASNNTVTVAPPGYYALAGAVTLTMCPAGTYSYGKATECNSCGANTTSLAGAAHCYNACPAHSQENRGVCLADSGYYFSETTKTFVPAPIGQYTNGAASRALTVCPVGSSTYSVGSQSYLECRSTPGYGTDDRNVTFHKCPIGYYQPGNVGNNTRDGDTCEKCPVGKTTKQVGTTWGGGPNGCVPP